MSREFVRQKSLKFSKLGKGRKKLQRWRKPKGRDSKMRLKMKGHPSAPTVGHKSSRKQAGLVHGLKPVLVHNLKELEQAPKNSIVLLAKIGAKKKIEIIAEAEKKNIKILNLGRKAK